MNWPNFRAEKLLIPIGISFYTFKTIGYCVDIYKRKYSPIESFWEYALSVSFFPQLIAGPIEKSVVIASQIKNKKNFDIINFLEGSKLILWGFFKKIVIADGIAQIINPVFDNIDNSRGLDFLVALIAFTYQVYADFSGYSDIAIGSAKCLGITLPPNFNKPYFSKNIREYWRRWHTTFSNWLKEYVFEPLGGANKNKKLRTLLNIFIVFLIVGLWHGATINYLLFSILAFVFLLIEIATEKYRVYLFSKLFFFKPLFVKKALTYCTIILMIAFMCVFFRKQNFDDSIYILSHLYPFSLKSLKLLGIISILAHVLIFEFLQFFQTTANSHCFQGMKLFYFRQVMYLIVLFSVILSSSRSEYTFQYFQF